jgi:hypothetical protein
VAGFIRILQLLITIQLTLQFTTHALSLLGLLSFTSPLVPASNGGRFPSSGFPNWNSLVLAQLNTLKSSSFWSCSRTASACHWSHHPTICNLLCNVMPCNNYWTLYHWSFLYNCKADQIKTTTRTSVVSCLQFRILATIRLTLYGLGVDQQETPLFLCVTLETRPVTSQLESVAVSWFVPNSLSGYHCSFFLDNDVLPWLDPSCGDCSSFAPAAVSLRQLVPISSLVRCKLVRCTIFLILSPRPQEWPVF